uniref:Uncharacterized protein n=1 Tax=Arundo donax TaxID=35708 RepID=A0A0A8Y067_ARUDO
MSDLAGRRTRICTTMSSGSSAQAPSSSAGVDSAMAAAGVWLTP